MFRSVREILGAHVSIAAKLQEFLEGYAQHGTPDRDRKTLDPVKPWNAQVNSRTPSHHN